MPGPFLLCQGHHQKATPQPDAFAAVPGHAAAAIGLAHHRGCRLDLAALSSLLYWGRRPDNRKARAYTLATGEEVALGPGEFVVSGLTVAEDLWRRFLGTTPPTGDADTPRDPAFDRFYRRVLRSIRALELAGWIREVETVAARVGDPARRGAWGTVWTFRGTPLQHTRFLPLAAAPVLSWGHELLAPEGSPPGDVEPQPGYVNPVAPLCGLFQRDEIRAGRRTWTEAVVHLRSTQRRDRPLASKALAWMRRIARGTIQEAHMRIGAWERGEIADREAPVEVPWIVLEIDADDFDTSLTHANALSRVLHHDGCTGLTTAHSGNRSAHVRIPSGCWRNPTFRDTEHAYRVLYHFARDLCERAGVPFGVIDKNCLRPTQTIRVPGSSRTLVREEIVTPEARGTPYPVGTVSVFANATSPGRPAERQPLAILEEIRGGRYRRDVERLRTLPPEDYREQKGRLPLATFSGTFAYRKAERLRLHSGLVVLDYDHIDADRLRTAVSASPHVLGAFTSPSGEGVKVLVRVQATREGLPARATRHQHRALYDVAAAHIQPLVPWAADALGTEGHDVARACFLSYDPHTHINPRAVPLAAEVEPVVREVVTGTARCTALPAHAAETCATQAEWDRVLHSYHRRHGPLAPEDPRDAPVSVDMVLALAAAADAATVPPPGEDDWKGTGDSEYQEAVRRITAEGVLDGEVWFSGDKEYQGRNIGAFHIALSALRREATEAEAWAVVEAAGARFQPPLAPSKLRSHFRGALRIIS